MLVGMPVSASTTKIRNIGNVVLLIGFINSFRRVVFARMIYWERTFFTHMPEKFPAHPSTESSEERNGMSRRDFIKKTIGAGLAYTLGSYGLSSKEAFADSKKEKEAQLEELRQRSFYEDYAKVLPTVYGDRLYTNAELLDRNFRPDQEPFLEHYLRDFPERADNKSFPMVLFELTPGVRFLQYFLRNGRERTLMDAERLGCKHRQTLLTESHVLTRLFSEADIDLQGEHIDWVEVPRRKSGVISREGARYGGNDEAVATVTAYSWSDDQKESPARKAGYDVNPKAAFDGVVINEMTHEIQNKYFGKLFRGDILNRLEEPFKSFVSEVPDLRFINNIQAAEFLSDVAEWSSESKPSRFFGPLYSMSENAMFAKVETHLYRYSYQVQRYAMVEVLRRKNISNPEKVVHDLIETAADYRKTHELHASARKYFKEEDFSEIAKIYRRIGVELLKKMKPYYSKQQ